jgi:hypothetical protein
MRGAVTMNYLLTNELIRESIQRAISEPRDPELKKRCEEYHQAINKDFEESWVQERFKWLFKKRRQKKLMREVRLRHMDLDPLFLLIENTIDDVLPKTENKYFGQIIDINKNTLDNVCEFCGSKDVKVETAVSLADPMLIQKYHRLKCCNCGRILSKDYEEPTDD